MPDSLVVGGNGFLGSHMVDALADAGHSVSVFDRFSSGFSSYRATGVSEFQGDFLDTEAVRRAVRGHDNVFHFLSTTAPATVDADPMLDVRTNVTGTIALLEACVEHDVRQLYFASTGGAIYGDQQLATYRESDRTLPVSPYAIGKVSLENYLRYYRVKHGLRSVALRISNPFGSRQKLTRVQGLVPIALRNQLRGIPTVRYGDGEMVRDYIYVSDAVRMIVQMTDRTPRRSIYNIGSSEGRTVNDVLTTVERVTGKPVVTEYRETPRTFVERVVLDTSRYREEFSAIDLMPFAEGVGKTWYDLQATA